MGCITKKPPQVHTIKWLGLGRTSNSRSHTKADMGHDAALGLNKSKQTVQPMTAWEMDIKIMMMMMVVVCCE